MPGNTPLSKAPLTLDDLLILSVRRFLAPLALSTLALGCLIGSMLSLLGGGGFGADLLLFLFGIPAALSAVGLLLVGLPAGYLVARLRRGHRESLFLLVGIGFAAGLVLPCLLWLGLGGFFDIFTALIFAGSGAVVAFIWALLNGDLFRTDNNGA
ncbi:MAG TPA: hypothetical protein VF552_04645 [Allosphingosinicella sp.]|jgi:hypothetical protein